MSFEMIGLAEAKPYWETIVIPAEASFMSLVGEMRCSFSFYMRQQAGSEEPLSSWPSSSGCLYFKQDSGSVEDYLAFDE